MQPTGSFKYRKLKNCKCFKIRKASRLVTQIYDKKLQPLDLKITQFSILSFIATSGEKNLIKLFDKFAAQPRRKMHFWAQFFRTWNFWWSAAINSTWTQRLIAIRCYLNQTLLLRTKRTALFKTDLLIQKEVSSFIIW